MRLDKLDLMKMLGQFLQLQHFLLLTRFKSGDCGFEDEERPGQPKKFEDE